MEVLLQKVPISFLRVILKSWKHEIDTSNTIKEALMGEGKSRFSLDGIYEKSNHEINHQN